MQRCKAMIIKKEWFGMMTPKVGNGPNPNRLSAQSMIAV